MAASALVPVISYLFQRGKCRQCGAAIALDHLAMELAAGLIGAVSFALLADRPVLALSGAVFGWVLLIIAALDLRHFWLPDRLTLPLAALGMISQFAGAGPGMAAALAGMAVGYVSLALVAWAYRALRARDGLGGGDPKLFAAIGSWLGWQALPWVLLAAACLGLAAGAAFHFTKRPVSGSARLPFGTLLAMVAWPIWLWSHLA